MANDFLARDVLVLAYKAFEGDMRGKTLLPPAAKAPHAD